MSGSWDYFLLCGLLWFLRFVSPSPLIKDDPTESPLPEGLWCRSFNWLEMTCDWNGPPQPYVYVDPLELAPTDLPENATESTINVTRTEPTTILYWTLHPKFGAFECPHPEGDTGCRWHRLDGADSFRPGMRYFMRLRTKTDTGFTWSQVFRIYTKNIVEPAPVTNITVQEVLKTGELGNFVYTDFIQDGRQEDEANQTWANDTQITNSSEWNQSLQKLMQMNTPHEAEDVTPSGAEVDREEPRKAKHVRHPKKPHKRMRSRRQLVPPLVEEGVPHKAGRYLVSWQKPDQLLLLPLEYRICYQPLVPPKVKASRWKGKQSVKREAIVTEEQFELELPASSSPLYFISIEAKPQQMGFWSQPVEMIIDTTAQR